MALLRIESGEIFTSLSKINKIIAPQEIGEFVIPVEVKKWVSQPLNNEEIQSLYQYIPPSLEKYCADKKVMRTSAWCAWEGSDVTIKKRIADSGIPHTDYGDEVHACFAGSLIFYFEQSGKQFALLIQAGDWIFIKKGIPVWAKPTMDYFFTFASYHADPKDQHMKNFVKCIDKQLL